MQTLQQRALRRRGFPAVRSSKHRERGRRRLSGAFARAHETVDRRFRSGTKRWLNGLAGDILARLKHAGSADIGLDELFNPADYALSFAGLIVPHLARASSSGIQFERNWIESSGLKEQSVAPLIVQAVEESPPPPSFAVSMTDGQIAAVNRFIAKKQVGVWNRVGLTTANRLRTTLRDGITAGDNFDQLQARVNKRMKKYAGWQSRRVARTETTGAMNHAQQIERDEIGIEEKGWVATVDARTRETHAAADGQEMANKDAFNVGGARLNYPGDGSLGAPAMEVINCRCVSVAAFPSGGSRGRQPPPPTPDTAPVQVDVANDDSPAHISFTGKSTKFGRKVWSAIGDGIADEEHARKVGKILRKEIDGKLSTVRHTFDDAVESAKQATTLAEKNAARKASKNAQNALAEKTQRVMRDALSKVRDLGGVEHSLTGNKAMRAGIRKAEAQLPKDWLDASDQIGPIKLRKLSRGEYHASPRWIAMESPQRFDTAAHELIHAMEHGRISIGKLEMEFKLRRAAGESLTRIYHGKSEWGYKDDFTDRYIGKDYGSGSKFHEIITMGWEGLLHGLYNVHRDADLVEFMLGVMAGV